MYEKQPAPEWAGKALKRGGGRIEAFLQQIGHPDWMPAVWYQPRNPEGPFEIHTRNTYFDRGLFEAVSERLPLYGTLMDLAASDGSNVGFDRWVRVWAPFYHLDPTNPDDFDLLENRAREQATEVVGRPISVYKVALLAERIAAEEAITDADRNLIAQMGIDPALYEKTPELVPEMPRFGCGAFGCVLPTGDDNVVLKLTHDKSEAQFAQVAVNMSAMGLFQPSGVVRYYAAAALTGLGRPGAGDLYLLWREVAVDVGNVGGTSRRR